MKILYHHRVASKDGQYVHIEEIIKAFRQLGHEVVVVEPDSVNQREFGEGSKLVSTMRAYIPGFIHELAEFGYSCLEYLKLRKAIIRHQPDVIYERYNLFFISGVWAARHFNLPYIVEVNSPLFEERSTHGRLALKRLARWTETLVWQSADYVLPVTAVLSQRIAAAGVPAERMQVIPNGVNRSEFSSVVDGTTMKKQLGIQQPNVLGFTGFVRDWHGLDRVISLMSDHDLQDWHFLVVGDGPVKAVLQEQAQRAGLEQRVTFTGLVNRDTIRDYVSCFDVALQPDVVDYASPLKLFEYLALGKAVLAPDMANIREILSNGTNASLFDNSSDEDFRCKLAQLCNDSGLRERLGRSARDLLEQQGYYWDENARLIVYLFQRLLQRFPAPVALRGK